MAKDRDQALDKAYSLESAEEVVDLYRDWADRYDHDTVERFGYVAPQRTVAVFLRHFSDRAARVIDVGCGTGLAGEVLRDQGFSNVDGLDISPEMLEAAREKGVYRELIEADLTKPLDIPTDSYDAVVSVGTFTHGHVGPEGLDELIRITRAGGVITFSINEGVYQEYGFEAAYRALADRGIAAVVETVQSDYLVKEGISSFVTTLKVAG